MEDRSVNPVEARVTPELVVSRRPPIVPHAASERVLWPLEPAVMTVVRRRHRLACCESATSGQRHSPDAQDPTAPQIGGERRVHFPRRVARADPVSAGTRTNSTSFADVDDVGYVADQLAPSPSGPDCPPDAVREREQRFVS